jgi:hypothetical protein
MPYEQNVQNAKFGLVDKIKQTFTSFLWVKMVALGTVCLPLGTNVPEAKHHGASRGH